MNFVSTPPLKIDFSSFWLVGFRWFCNFCQRVKVVTIQWELHPQMIMFFPKFGKKSNLLRCHLNLASVDSHHGALFPICRKLHFRFWSSWNLIQNSSSQCFYLFYFIHINLLQSFFYHYIYHSYDFLSFLILVSPLRSPHSLLIRK